MKNIDVAKIIKDVKTSGFFRNTEIPLGYVDGLPIITVKNEKPCLIIPFLKYKVTGVVDKTLVFPIKYYITVSLSDGKIIGYTDLSFEEMFKKIDFNKPIGFFRHEAVKNYSKFEYKEKKQQLYKMYDKIISAMLAGETCDIFDVTDFTELLNIIIEPSLKPIYEALDKDFYNKYLK